MPKLSERAILMPSSQIRKLAPFIPISVVDTNKNLAFFLVIFAEKKLNGNI